jgi:hypothetical protein
MCGTKGVLYRSKGGVMIIGTLMLAVWAFLALRSVMADYRYYRAVQTLEPAIWAQLGSPKFLRIPMAFVSSKGVILLKSITNEHILALATKHRQAGIQFISYLVIVLVGATAYFRFA